MTIMLLKVGNWVSYKVKTSFAKNTIHIVKGRVEPLNSQVLEKDDQG